MTSYVDLVVDLQFGSTGKGALSGWLSMNNGYDAAVSVNMPNAGHTAYDCRGNKFIHKVLPSGVFGDRTMILGVGPGSIFDPMRLMVEIRGLENAGHLRDNMTVMVHETAGVLSDEHAKIEANSLGFIASTMQGSAAAMCDKIMRSPSAVAKSKKRYLESLHRDIVVVNNSEWLRFLNGRRILLEGSQGYSLGISAGFYPYCTSRDCTPARVMADAGFPLSWMDRVFGSCRVHPIRVGNTSEGTSGEWYPDQTETTFEALGVEPETTTVTGRIRRVASFSDIQIKEAMMMADPFAVFLNFAQYNQKDTECAIRSINESSNKLRCGGVKYVGRGPLPGDIEVLPWTR